MKIEIVPHNPMWKNAFELEAQQLRAALAGRVAQIHHIGSTSIPDIYAKPIVDILVEADDLSQVDQCNSAMVTLGYQVMGEYGILGRRYFRKENAQGKRTHHVHIFQVGSSDVTRHLAFRDYVKAYPDVGQQYSELKRSLISQIDSDDMEAYLDGKDSFIKMIQERAITWNFAKNNPLGRA